MKIETMKIETMKIEIKKIFKEFVPDFEKMKEIEKVLNKLRKIHKELKKKIEKMPTESKKINEIILEPDGVLITEQCTIGTTNPAKVLSIYENKLRMMLLMSGLTFESPSESDNEKIFYIRQDIKDLAPDALLSVFSDPSVKYIKKVEKLS